MYFYIWISCKKMYKETNCFQKYFVQISVANRGFYRVSLLKGYFSVRTIIGIIVSWLILRLNLGTLLRNFAANNVLCMWSPVLYEQINAIFCNGVQYSSQASSGKAVEFYCHQSEFFKKIVGLIILIRFQWGCFNVSLNLLLAENNPAI